MTGISYTVTIDDEKARQYLQRLVAKMENPLGFYQSVGDHLSGATGENFKRETAPDGTAWTPLQPSTLRRRIKKGNPKTDILRVSGGLAGSINARPSNTEVRIGSAVPYAAIHQLGGTINRPARQGKLFNRSDVKVRAYTITIPARPYLGVSKDDERIIIEIADEWLRGE